MSQTHRVDIGLDYGTSHEKRKTMKWTCDDHFNRCEYNEIISELWNIFLM